MEAILARLKTIRFTISNLLAANLFCAVLALVVAAAMRPARVQGAFWGLVTLIYAINLVTFVRALCRHA
jgi:hypothetical protein